MGLLILNNKTQIYNCLLQWNVKHRYYTMKVHVGFTRYAFHFVTVCIITSAFLTVIQYQKPTIFLDTTIIFPCVATTATQGLGS